MNFEKELSKKVKETDLCVQSFLPESGKYKELIVESVFILSQDHHLIVV